MTTLKGHSALYAEQTHSCDRKYEISRSNKREGKKKESGN